MSASRATLIIDGAKAVGEVLPHLSGRLDGIALRVPVVDGSLVDLAVLLGQEVTAEDVNAAFESAAREGSLVGALRFTNDATVSSDIVGSPYACVFDAELTQAAGRFAKVFGWYDNEWGYMCQLTELTRLVAAGLTYALGRTTSDGPPRRVFRP
jgi:glyceraldehyde 3-phosphate dehydrogenase